ncbi:FxLD family lanthipeptide [Cryptosporangium minutisporangium]
MLTETHDDFVLDVQVTTDTAVAQGAAAPCTTNDGCAPTCASSCASAV